MIDPGKMEESSSDDKNSHSNRFNRLSKLRSSPSGSDFLRVPSPSTSTQFVSAPPPNWVFDMELEEMKKFISEMHLKFTEHPADSVRDFTRVKLIRNQLDELNRMSVFYLSKDQYRELIHVRQYLLKLVAYFEVRHSMIRDEPERALGMNYSIESAQIASDDTKLIMEQDRDYREYEAINGQLMRLTEMKIHLSLQFREKYRQSIDDYNSGRRKLPGRTCNDDVDPNHVVNGGRTVSKRRLSASNAAPLRSSSSSLSPSLNDRNFGCQPNDRPLKSSPRSAGSSRESTNEPPHKRQRNLSPLRKMSPKSSNRCNNFRPPTDEQLHPSVYRVPLMPTKGYCTFCGGLHWSYLCLRMPNLCDRKDYFLRRKLCFVCGRRHRNRKCRCSPKHCKWPQCGQPNDHIPALCPNVSYPITMDSVVAYEEKITELRKKFLNASRF